MTSRSPPRSAARTAKRQHPTRRRNHTARLLDTPTGAVSATAHDQPESGQPTLETGPRQRSGRVRVPPVAGRHDRCDVEAPAAAAVDRGGKRAHPTQRPRHPGNPTTTGGARNRSDVRMRTRVTATSMPRLSARWMAARVSQRVTRRRYAAAAPSGWASAYCLTADIVRTFSWSKRFVMSARRGSKRIGIVMSKTNHRVTCVPPCPASKE